jgi:hypothetical protein
LEFGILRKCLNAYDFAQGALQPLGFFSKQDQAVATTGLAFKYSRRLRPFT